MKSAATEKVTALATFVAAYIASDIKIHNAIRTPFDELDAQLRGGGFIRPRSGNGYWFNKKNFRKSQIVELVMNHFDHISPEAGRALSLMKSNDFSDEVSVICEHVVPCSTLEEMLKDRHKHKPLDADGVLVFHNQFYRRAIITRIEDRQLNSHKLRRKMPKDWNRESGCPFDRYRAAELEFARDWR